MTRVNHDEFFADFLSALNSEKFQILRPAQERVLSGYLDGFENTADVAVQLPTGAGKTLIALLIAEHRRRAGEKVAILSANKTLARQTLQESTELGIPAVLMEGTGSTIPGAQKRRFHRAQAIAIMNYWVYFNQNPVIDPADLLIMDDAHLAEHCLHSLYSVEITRSDHGTLFEALVSELFRRFPEYSVLGDALDFRVDATKSPELLSFIDQCEVSTRIEEIIEASDAVQSNVDLRFRWHRMRSHVKQSNIYLAKDSLWIRPYIYPVISNRHYSEAKQRIYMSATIGDPGDLSRRLGVRSIKPIPVPPEESEATFGRRLLLMNRLDEQDIPERLGAAILTALQNHPKSVWLCASVAAAAKYQVRVNQWLAENQLVGHPSWILTPEGDEIEEFKRSAAGHLFVGGRFDGMDFNGDECRLVILTTLPRAINTQEEFISSYLGDSGFMRERLNQRVVQALGRCNRHEGDYAVYALADRRFATYFGLDSNKRDLPKNIIAELDMGQDAAEDDGSSLCASVEKFLSGDFGEYDEQLKQYMADVPTEKTRHEFTDTSNDEVVGWSALFSSENYTVAQQRFERCWDAAKKDNLLEIGAFHGWHRAKALHLHGLLGDTGSQQRALEVLEAAIQRGGQSAWFNRMRGSLHRARAISQEMDLIFGDENFFETIRAFDDVLDRCGVDGIRFEQYCNRITEQLTSESHNIFQVGLETVGTLLGYTAWRPQGSGAADCIWKGNFGSYREVVTYEAKVEHSPSNEIILSDIGQAHSQKARADGEYETSGYVVRGAIVTHLEDLGQDVEGAMADLRVIPKKAVYDLWLKIRAALVDYRTQWSPDDSHRKLQAAQSIKARFPQTGWLVRALNQDRLFVTSELLLNEWGS